MRELLITVHGIHTKGLWQDQLEDLFGPHFDCKPIRYRAYQYAGMFLLAAPALGVLGAITLVILILFESISLWSNWFWILAGTSLFLCLAEVIVRTGTLYKLKADIAKARKAYLSAPHVIAHSFGTYLSCWALHDFDDILFRRIILAGSVLPRSFPWAKILNRKPRAFEDVRNEVGLKDWVVMLAGWIGFLVRRVGTAGVHGFRGEINFVHTRETWSQCVACAASSKSPLVHNITLRGNPHWISLLQDGHPEDIWLPYLWGYEASEYQNYKQLCDQGASAVLDDHIPTMKEVERSFREQRWTWTKEKSCEEYLAVLAIEFFRAKKAIPQPDQIADIVQNAIYKIWLGAHTAKRESALPRARRDDKVARYLNPGWLFIEKIRSESSKTSRGGVP